MDAQEVIANQFPTKPGPIAGKDNKNVKERKLSAQKKYTNAISMLLRALVGTEHQTDNGTTRRDLDSKFVTQLMALTDSEYRKKIVSYMKIFINALKLASKLKRQTDGLTRDQVVRKTSDGQTFFLSKGWSDELIKTVGFFMTHTTKLFTANRKKTRAPTARNQYRFALDTEQGISLLLDIARATGVNELEALITRITEDNHMSLVTITTSIRYMIKSQASAHINGLISDSLLSDLRKIYDFSTKVKKDGTKSVVIRAGRSKAKQDLVKARYDSLKDKVTTVVNGQIKAIDYSTPRNNTFLREVMNLTLRATNDLVNSRGETIPENADKSKAKVATFFGGDEEIPLGDLIRDRRTLAGEILKDAVDNDQNLERDYAGGDSKARRVAMSAGARIIQANKKIEKKAEGTQDSTSLAIASDIVAYLGAIDNNAASRILTEQQIADNKADLQDIKSLLDDADDVQLIKRFLDDIVKYGKKKSQTTREGPAVVQKRGARPAGVTRPIGRSRR